MAIEPYRRKIGLPDAPGPSGMADTRVLDIGPSIASLGDTLLKTFEPIHKEQALKRAQEDAGNVPLEMDADGNYALPQAERGGRIYAAAFDEVAKSRYLNQVNIDYQNFLNAEISARRARTEGKPYDPDDFEATVAGRLKGVLDGIDPLARPDAEALLGREMLERTRTFRDEWSRTQLQQTMAGLNDQNRFYINSAANWRERPGETLETVTERYIKPLQQNIEAMKRMALAGDREADALMMQSDQLTDGIESYTRSVEAAAVLLPAVGGMGAADLQQFEYWLSGIPAEGGLSGLVRGAGGASAKVDPASLREHFKITFGFDPTSVERGVNDKLTQANPGSHHSIANGGRAVDSPRIEGMTFDQYVQSWKDAGFTVVEAIDEYKNPSPHATGGHWHVALGNTRALPGEVSEIPEVKGITYEAVMALDPSVRSTLKQVVTDRRQVLAQQEADSRREAAEAARHREQVEKLETLTRTVDGANSGGFGGNWTSEEKGLLNQRFAATVDMSQMHNGDVRALTSRWIAQNNYVPREVVNYFDSATRHPSAWRPALELYNNLKTTTMGNGARVGDLLVMELEPRTRALIEEAQRLKGAGSTDEEIGARLESLRSGSGFTAAQAQSAYNDIVGGEDRTRSYKKDRDAAIIEAYGLPASDALSPELTARIDASYAANLDLADRNPERALQRALEQNSGLIARSGMFVGNTGPAVLTGTYKAKQLLDFFVGATDPRSGKTLVPKGQGHVLGGPNSTIKLRPLGNALSSIGRYEVRVYDPKNKSNIIDRFEVDLGSELNGFYRQNDRQVTRSAATTPLEAARQERARVMERGRRTAEDLKRNPLGGGPRY